MDCFQDFCLNCDREATSGAYCSQTCKLADLDRARESSMLATTSTTEQQLTKTTSEPSTKPLDWTQTYTQPSATDDRSRQPAYFMRTSAPAPPPLERQRSLTPSSSRSSLSSNTSNTSATISEQSKQELQAFFHAFDQAKASKRRQSTW